MKICDDYIDYRYMTNISNNIISNLAMYSRGNTFHIWIPMLSSYVIGFRLQTALDTRNGLIQCQITAKHASSLKDTGSDM